MGKRYRAGEGERGSFGSSSLEATFNEVVVETRVVKVFSLWMGKLMLCTQELEAAHLQKMSMFHRPSLVYEMTLDQPMQSNCVIITN